MLRLANLLVTTGIFGITLPNLVQASTACHAHNVGNHEIVIQIAGRQISILGWTHLEDEESKPLVEGVKAAHKAALAGRCLEAVQAAKATVENNTVQFERARHILDRLSSLNQIAPFTSIGIEMSPTEFEDQLKLNISIDRVFSDLDNRCGPELKDASSKLKVMLPGPEFAFHRLHDRISIKPLENEEIKAANAKDFEGGAEDSFNYQNPAMTHESHAAVEKIRSAILNEIEPTDSLISLAVSFETDLVRRSELEKQLRYSVERGKRIIRGAYRRNVAIAGEILNSQGNMAIPIGYRHVDHLAREVLRQCQLTQKPCMENCPGDTSSAAGPRSSGSR